MSRTVEHKKLDTPTGRAKLTRGRAFHYQSLITGKAALGYQRNQGASGGRWLLRRFLGPNRYSVTPLGLADDATAADGEAVFSFDQARAKALEVIAQGSEAAPRGITVRRAYAKYIEYLANQGKRTLETERRGAVLIMPELGDLKVAELTSERIRKWHAGIAARPAFLRSSKKAGKKTNTKADPVDDEAVRKRRVSANRVLTMLKAALNYAYDEKWVSNNEAWGRRVKPFKGVDAARIEFLELPDAKRFLNAAEPSFRKIATGALQTGCRYGELCRLKVGDFSPSAGTILIAQSKSGKARHVVLSPEGIVFFKSIAVGRKASELMFRNDARLERERVERERLIAAGKTPAVAAHDTGEWRHGEQAREMRLTCERAKLKPIGFHILRHTYGSLSSMGGMALNALQQNLGHADMRMTTKHYAHLSPGFMKDQIRDKAPRFGFVPDKKVVAFGAK